MVISGLGFVLPLGHTRAELLAALHSGQTAFVHSLDFPGTAVAPAAFLPKTTPEGRLVAGWRHRRYLNRGARFSVEAGLRAVSAAGFALSPGQSASMPPESGLVCAAGPMLDIRSEFDPAGQARDALWLLRWLPNTPSSALAALLGLRGQGLTVCTACSAALQALGEAARQIAHGLAEVVLVTAGDSRLSPTGLMAYAQARAICLGLDPSDPLAPSTCGRPFDLGRSGFVAGEGGAAFVLESLESAERRGQRPLAEILGFAASLDAASLTAPDPLAASAEACVLQALGRAALTPADIDWVSAHGTGTPANDQAETRLLESIFGQSGPGPVVTALKSWLGHLASACGAAELALAMTAGAQGFIPAIRNLTRPCSNQLDLAHTARPLPGPVGLLENFGFGGQNSALVVKLCL